MLHNFCTGTDTDVREKLILDTSIKLNDRGNAWLYLVLRPVWYTPNNSRTVAVYVILLCLLWCKWADFVCYVHWDPCAAVKWTHGCSLPYAIRFAMAYLIWHESIVKWNILNLNKQVHIFELNWVENGICITHRLENYMLHCTWYEFIYIKWCAYEVNPYKSKMVRIKQLMF